MYVKSLFRLSFLVASILPVCGLMSCGSDSVTSPQVAPVLPLFTAASVTGLPGATTTRSNATMPVGVGAAPIVSSSTVAAPGGAITLNVQTVATASQILVGVQGQPGYLTINLGAARSRQTGRNYQVAFNLGTGTLPNPLVLMVETVDQNGTVSLPTTVSLVVSQGTTGNSFAGQYVGNFSGNVVKNGVSTPINGPMTAIVDSSGVLTSIFSPTQAGQQPAVFVGTVSPTGVVSATSPQGDGALTLTGNFVAQGSGIGLAGNLTGPQTGQITWAATRTSTTVSTSLFAGTYNGSFTAATSQNTPVSGPLTATVGTNGSFTATGTPTQPGTFPTTFTGTVSPTGALSAVGTPSAPQGTQVSPITLTGAFQIANSVVTGAGGLSNTQGTSGNWSLQPSLR